MVRVDVLRLEPRAPSEPLDSANATAGDQLDSDAEAVSYLRYDGRDVPDLLSAKKSVEVAHEDH